jgi:pantetheine-phosphate adenylyltransferase
MSKTPRRLAIFPGTFDPVTYGHLDVIHRGARLFDEVVVAVGENPEKASLLSRDQRVAILREVVAELGNVRVESYSGLTVDVARKFGAAAILRGLRNTTDLHFELQAALTNRTVAGVETVFILASPEFAFTSSSLIKQLAEQGGDISALVPPAVLRHLQRPGETKGKQG